MTALPVVDDRVPSREALLALYGSVGWSAYTDRPDLLEAAVAGSSWVGTIWDGDRLVALARCISDDATIAYLQDVLVCPDRQREGLGRRLVSAMLVRYAHCRQVVLLTDDRPEQTAFYESLGLVRTDLATTATLRTFARMPGLR